MPWHKIAIESEIARVSCYTIENINLSRMDAKNNLTPLSMKNALSGNFFGRFFVAII